MINLNTLSLPFYESEDGFSHEYGHFFKHLLSPENDRKIVHIEHLGSPLVYLSLHPMLVQVTAKPVYHLGTEYVLLPLTYVPLKDTILTPIYATYRTQL